MAESEPEPEPETAPLQEQAQSQRFLEGTGANLLRGEDDLRREKMAKKKQSAVTVTAMRNGSDKTVTEEISIHRTSKLGIPTTSKP